MSLVGPWMQQTLRGDPLMNKSKSKEKSFWLWAGRVWVFDLVTLSQVRSGKTAGGWLLVTQTRL